MKKIATLGPAGTFSDLATTRYLAAQNTSADVHYFPTITSTLREIGRSCEMGIIPIENFSEGFIALVLDELIEADLSIVGEVILPIDFSLVSSVQALSDITQLYVQFVARGQCCEFIESLGNIEIITTESNIESLDKVKSSTLPCAAIVPSNSVKEKDFATIINEVNDYKHNQTRFLVLSKHVHESKIAGTDKTSIIVLDDDDHPGLLGEMLLCFSKRKINLTSIISRPTRKEFGKYHFFIDFEGHVLDPLVAEALHEISQTNKVKLLGSYSKAKHKL